MCDPRYSAAFQPTVSEKDSPQKTIFLFIYYLLHNCRCRQVAVHRQKTSKADAEAAQKTAEKILYKRHFYWDKVLSLIHRQMKMSASISSKLLVWGFQGDEQLVEEKTLDAPLAAVRLTFKWKDQVPS